MTIPLGRRRLTLAFGVTTAPAATHTGPIPPETDDHELARLSRRSPLDVDRARWEGLALIYGGHRRP